MCLTLVEANSIIRRAITKAEEIGIPVCVAVCDEGGRLIAFARMDGAKWASAYGAQGKAIASSAFQRASGELQQQADSVIFRGIVTAEGGNMILSQGAVPIVRDGMVIGACGVGGARKGEQDEECARAGVSALGS